MKLRGYMLFILSTAAGSVYAQTRPDTTFSLLFNSSLSFTHANDPHINRWLEKYGYPAVPRVPNSINFELAAIPADSRQMYTIRLSMITSGHDLPSFNTMPGLYASVLRCRNCAWFAGARACQHADITALNGQLPPAYQEQAAQYNT